MHLMKFYANAACIKRFPNAEYAQVLINREQKILALRPCEEFSRDSFPWSKISKGKREPKAITCKLFYAKIFDMMGWIPDFRYKLLGKVIHSNGEYLLAFDLTATEVYQKTISNDERLKVCVGILYIKDIHNFAFFFIKCTNYLIFAACIPVK